MAIADASAFIGSLRLQETIIDEPRQLLARFSSCEFKDDLIQKVGLADYNRTIETLKQIVAKQEQEGCFEPVKNLIDTR